MKNSFMCRCGCGRQTKSGFAIGHHPNSQKTRFKNNSTIGDKYFDRGYVRIKTDSGWHFEHRVVAEKKLGRKLKSNEVVHHIDGNRSNNTESNLLVYGSNKHHLEQHITAESIDFICATCGNTFSVPKYNAVNRSKNNGEKPKFCSRMCFGQSLKDKPFSGRPGHPHGGYRRKEAVSGF